MERLFKLISNLVVGRRQTSESVKVIEDVFDSYSEQQVFFDLVYDRFEHYDRLNDSNRNVHFPADIDFIICCTTASLTVPECQRLFSSRVDAYFYIYRRCIEYLKLAEKPKDQMKEFRKQLHQQLVSTFELTQGSEPNLYLKNKDIIQRINIREHLMCITEINDIKTLRTFFVLCKLSFQSSLAVDDNNQLQWLDIFRNIRNCKLSLMEIISEYIEYKQAFEQRPLDITTFIHLIKTTSLPQDNQTSPFEFFINTIQKLNLDHKMFFDQFQSVFADGVTKQLYKFRHIAALFHILSTHNEQILNTYLKMYSSNVASDKLWSMFLCINENCDINETMQKHLSIILAERLDSIPIEIFEQHYRSAKAKIKQTKEENRSRPLKVVEDVLHALLNKQLNNDAYSYRLTESSLKNIFNIAVELLSTNDFQHPIYLLIFRQLFKLDKKGDYVYKKIGYLFERLNNFERSLYDNNDPVNIIRDEWLNDYIFLFPQEWIKINKHDYQGLCDNHHNNRWSIHVWSRIIHLSVMKSESMKTNEILKALNEWMKNVKHDNYDPKNILTIIFVKTVFENIIAKHTKPILSLPNISLMIQYVIHIRDDTIQSIDRKLVDEFIETVKQSIKDVLLLNGTRTMYLHLSNDSIAYHFLPDIDLRTIIPVQDPQLYKFLNITPQIDSIVSMKKPDDIDTTEIESKEHYFVRFVKQVNAWLLWFDRFIDIFQYIIECFHTWKMDGAEQLLSDIQAIRNDPTMTVLKIKATIQKIVKVLKLFKEDLERLCDLFNCLQSFAIVKDAALSNRDEYKSYMTNIKTSHSKNTFTVNPKIEERKYLPVKARQHVHWSLACIQHHCNIKIEYRTNEPDNQNYELFCKKDVPLDKQYLEGEFNTQRDGHLIIIIDNSNVHVVRTIWYRLTQTNLSTCHLFHGIFNMYHRKYFSQLVNENDLALLINRVFLFIDKLLDGDTTLDEMNHLKTVFHDKNINVREEVQKLFSNKKSEKTTDPEQVCEWLRTYQVYSHLSIIIDCVQKFKIISGGDEIDHLQDMIINEDCSLKDMSKTYKDLYQRFQKLSNNHLQLIKLIVECPNVVKMMEKFDLYSSLHGLRRFQELRDNLTTQFQLQERNNMVLNSWICTYTLCEPFVREVKNLEEFVDNLSQLSNIDESSLEHIKIVNDNLQIVTLWLSAEETTMLDNALITMEHIYRAGIVKFRLRRLMHEQSYFEIEYSIDKITTPINNEDDVDNDEQEDVHEKHKFTLSMADIDDHKRQLTFCNVDLEQKMIYKKILLREQLNLLQIIEKIHSILVKLEMAGHPNFQLKENNYKIYDRYGRINRILLDLKTNPDNYEQQLIEIIQERTNDFERIYRGFQIDYDRWIKDLEEYRHNNRLLKLFSNRQVMIMIILLTTPSKQNPIQRQFLEKLFSSDDRQFHSTIVCLIHYLQSLRINDCNLSIDNITTLYEKHKIEPGPSTDISLEKLCAFLKEVFNNGKELFMKKSMNNENQQYFITLERTNDRIENDFDLDTCCILLNIFNDRLPADYQILWGSISTEDDIRLFFSRVRAFRYLTFAVMDIDKMHHRLRQLVLNEQDSLAKQSEPHGPIYYFSRELTLCRKSLRPFVVTSKHRNPSQAYAQLRRNNWSSPQIQIIYGTAGIGKTHRIKTQYKDANTSCVSINDKINVSSLIRSFISFDSNNQSSSSSSSVYFNISIHAPFEQLNRLLFSLFICGSLSDLNSGLTFSSSITKPWRYIIEVPFTEKSNLTIQENFHRILPLLSIISSNNLQEVTDGNYQLFIGEEEELVARYLRAYHDQQINTFMKAPTKRNEVEKPISFDPLTDHNECRDYIYHCMTNYAPELPRNKIFKLSFTKFLYRRIRFFTGVFYRFNMTDPYLGSTTMKQMINEAKCLTHIDFSSNDYPRVYLVYDPGFSLYLLHNDWNSVPPTLKALFDNCNPSTRPEFEGKDYFISCLSWLIDISYEMFEKLMNEKKFILTENFVYKLFHVHERKLTKLALIIEGETGVGKTFLLNFYSALLNSNIIYGKLDNDISPRILERTSLWLSKNVIHKIIEKEPDLLNRFLQKIESKLDGDVEDLLVFDEEEDLIQLQNDPTDPDLLRKIKSSLEEGEYNSTVLRRIWKTILIQSEAYSENIAEKLIDALYNFIIKRLTTSPLIEGSPRLLKLIEEFTGTNIQESIDMFDEFVLYSKIKPLFYRLLLHPGVTEEQIDKFMTPISQLAKQIPSIEFVVFFDEFNTSSCLGLFKEMFMDGTLHGKTLPQNIFFTAAINPLIHQNDEFQVHRRDYLVHELPQSLENLKVSYGILDPSTLEHYVRQKIAVFTVGNTHQHMPLNDYAQNMLAESILQAQKFCEERLGRNSVSQREIQRCFNLIDFFWKMKYDEDDDEPDPMRCIALSLALIYYFRLPTKEDNAQRNDKNTPSREELGDVLSGSIPNFVERIQNELEKFVNTDNFVIPNGVAVNQAIREHIFAIVVSIVTRTPLCIIGAPGQSKTLSFQIVLQNLQGSQLSTKSFCKRLPEIDPFFCLGSKYSRPEDIAYVFDRAIEREQQYQQNRIDRRCVVFLDEASLPDEKKMVLKVLHPYLDECKVAFVAVANKSFDAANANRMICVYRSLPSKDDQKILAYGCLGLPIVEEQNQARKQLDNIIYGLCQGYRRVLTSSIIPHIFHDRDFIYMLRELRFELSSSIEEQETSINSIKPKGLLRALEDNFNGIKQNEFEELVKIFFESVEAKSPSFSLSNERRQENFYRDIPTILSESMKLDSKRRRLYGRYKLIIDESEDESAINLLLQTGILNSDPSQTTVFRMSDFSDDVNNELRNVGILSTIKLCMETGKTILMVNTSRIHGSLYDVFNQNFSIMATGDMRKIFSKVAIGPKTIDVVVHEDFQCIVHIKRSELKDTPAPFLSRFQKYSLSVNDFYRIHAQKLPPNEQIILRNIEEKAQSFIQHFGREYFYGLNESTLYSCLLPLIKINDHDEHSLLNVHQFYTQFTQKLKSFIEQNPADTQQCLLRLVLSKLIQLVSPESIILKLPTFEGTIGQLLCNLYFEQQEHFNIENFIRQFLSNPLTDDVEQMQDTIHMTTKAIIFTRTSSYVVSLSQQSKNEVFSNYEENDHPIREKIDILNLGTIENSVELQDRFNHYENDRNKNVLLIVIDGRIGQQRLHIPYVRQLIDKTEYTCNTNNNQIERKYFLILIHFPAQDLYHQSCFPSIFLHNWDFYFFDTCASGSAFHLQKMLRIISSSSSSPHDSDNVLCDLNILFEDCLWDFCSRIQIILPELPKDMFTDKMAYEFYQRQTNTIHRVKCIKQILQRASQLQKHIVDIYHEHLLSKKYSSEKIYKLIHAISKEILCGKRFDSLIDSIQAQTKNSFTNFVSNIFKFIVNDYGLDTLTKLSIDYQNYGSLLTLIDYQSFATKDDQDLQGIFQLITHYSCIPQTPLYHLLHQRIKTHANEIKLTFIRENENEINQKTFEQFRYKLIDSIMNDKILTDIICERILHSYSNDLVRTVCTIAENNFNNDLIQYQQTIEFITRWLLLIDEDDRQSLEQFPNQYVWQLAHVYTSIEYEQNDLISMYSACRIIDRLDPTQKPYENLFNDENITRSDVRKRFFRLIFDYLWENLVELCSKNGDNQAWIYTYTFISKYYPSEKVLQSAHLIDIKCQIDFMSLAYSIFLNEKTTEPQELINSLLKETKFNTKSDCLKLLPDIMEIIHRRNPDNSTLPIDLQQWILSILKNNTQEINFLFKYLDQSTCQLSLGMKQFLFDELIHRSLKVKQPNREKPDLWDRLDFIPTMIECTSDPENYQIPSHPSVLPDDEDLSTRPVLLDLYFFHLQRQMTNETITDRLLNKGMMLKLPKIENRRLKPIAENLFKQLRDYFRVKIIALLLCESNLNEEKVPQMLSAITTELLSIDQQPDKFTHHLQLFLSTIISKQSWNYLLDLLKRLNNEWATKLYDLLKFNQGHKQSRHLHLHHQIQFTLSSDNHASIFPKLHQPYEELRKIIDTCVQNDTDENQWNDLSDWIQLKLNSNPMELQLNEIKVMLLLIIYYDYYCNNQLSSIDSILELIQNVLQLSSEEFRVFTILIRPKEFMIGYQSEDSNLLNNLFQLKCEDQFELTLRHMLINLMAMILLGGKQSFLWTFVFEPLRLQRTYGFGSTTQNFIQEQGVHYDCGCILSQNGDLIRFTNLGDRSELNVPAVYIVYFSTFGALAWHLLLFNTSVENLNGPIFSPSIIADATPGHELAGNSIRAKVCHFVCTRLMSTYHFLSVQFNQHDACILLTRCFEQMAYLTTQNQNLWIKPLYTTLIDQYEAEKEYQDKVFYFIHEKLVEYKTYVNQLNNQSQIQKNLQDFIDQTPMVIQFTHFKTELYRPRNSPLSLKILQHIFNSFDFLKITKLIYDLSQFYILLHQTYTQLIERNEFSSITLNQLYDRGQKHSQNDNRTIIDNGIAAVNAYHKFADGLIRPGACDETQRFTIITFDTPVSYLVTNENHDEGDIIMRILSVLVDYHNNSLDLLEKEYNHTNGILKNLVNELISKQVSIIKVANDNTGVITLTEQDCSWIERLSQASLTNNEYFLTANSRLTFDFTYVQSQIIRTYLLLCRINYQHITQKYQCYTKRIETTTSLDLDEKYLVPMDDERIEKERMFLKEMPLDKLYHAHSQIRQIALKLKNHPDDLSSTNLFQFAKKIDIKLEQYEIQDFQLCHIDHVLELYEKSMSSFQYLFTDIPPLLQVPIEKQLKEELIENLNRHIIDIDYRDDTDTIQFNIQMISKLLDELKSIEDILLQRSSQSLIEICKHITIENPILSWIPNGIKCENYVALNIHLIEMRSILQERKMNIEEKEMKLWEEDFNSDKQTNVFREYINLSNEEQTIDVPGDWILPSMNIKESTAEYEQPIAYSPLMELNIKLVPCTSSAFIEQIHQYRKEPRVEPTATTKAQKFTIIQSDGKPTTYLWKVEKLSEQLKKVFDPNVFAIVDKNELVIDLTKIDTRPISLEYRILEKQSLIQVRFQFRSKFFEYLTTFKCQISTIVHRFIDDGHQLQSLALNTVLGFFDQYGKCIDDGIIADLCPTDSCIASISVIEKKSITNTFSVIALSYKEDQNQSNLFYPTTTWQQIGNWLKNSLQKIDPCVENYAFMMKEQQTILDDNQTIASVINANESATVDIVDRNSIIKIVFSYETNRHCIDTFESTKIFSLLNNEGLLRQLNLTSISPDDYILMLGETILTKKDLEQTVGTYSTAEDRSIHFRISIFVSITKYDNQEQIKLPISSRNITIEQILQLTGKSIDVYKYLALNTTKRILDSNEIVSNSNETKFVLLKENETCLVWLGKSDSHENEENQRYAVFASLADISHRHLLYGNDFAPSPETQLTSFSSESPIRFIVIDSNLPISVTVQNKETNQIITFNCLHSMTAKRICDISSQLFGSNKESYRLIQDDYREIDDDISLADIDEMMTKFQFQVTPTISMNCSIKFLEQTIVLPCEQDTLSSTIIIEALKKLQISGDKMNQYELIALDDDQTQIDFDTSIEEIRELFSSTITTIPLELRIKNE